MPVGGLSAGSVYADVGARFHDEAFDRFDRRMDQAEARARKGIDVELGVNDDKATRGLESYERQVRSATAATADLTREDLELRRASLAVERAELGVAQAARRRIIETERARTATDNLTKAEQAAAAALATHGAESKKAAAAARELEVARRAATDAGEKARDADLSHRESTLNLERATRKAADATEGLGRAAANAGGAFGGGGGLNAHIGGLSGGLARLGGIGIAVSPVLIGIAGALTALASSAAAAAAGAGAVGVGFVGALLPLGALAAAVTSRIGAISDASAALDAQQEGSAAAAQANATRQTAAAQAVESAEQSLADAHRQVKRDQEAVTEARRIARREVTDLALALEGAVISEQRASLSLQEAQERMAEVQADPEARRRDRQQAALDVREAELAVRRSRIERGRADADAKRGTETVVDAERQLADSRRNVQRATAGVAAATAAAARSADQQSAAALKANRLLGELTSTERGLLGRIRSIRETAREVTEGATDAVFGGVNRALTRVEPELSRYEGRLERIGERVGGVFDRAARSLTSPEWRNALDAFAATAERIVDPISNAVGDFIGTARNIAVAALPLVEEFAEWLEDAFDSLERGTSNGRKVRSVIRDLVDSTKDWAGFLGAVGDLLVTVFGGGKKDGDDMVDSMTRLVRRWDEFLETEEGQRKMRKFFHDAKTTAEDLGKVIGGLAGALLKVYEWYGRLQDGWSRFELAVSRGAHVLAMGIREAFVDLFDFILGGFSSIAGGVSSLLSAMGRVPGFGWAKDAARDIDDMRDSVDRSRRSMREWHEELGKRRNIELLQDEVQVLRDRLKRLDKGSEDYRETAEKLRSKQRALNAAVADAEGAGRKGSRGIKAIGSSARTAAEAAAEAGEMISGDFNAIAEQFGLKPLKYTSKLRGKRSSAAHEVAGERGDDNPLLDPVFPRAGGGWVGRRDERGPDNVMVPGPWGTAAVGAGELLVFNAEQQDALEGALVNTYGTDLDGFFGGASWTPHYATPRASGGRVTRHARGGIVPIPGEPGESIHSSILRDVLELKRRYRLDITDGYATSGHAPGGEHPRGLAIDAIPGRGGSWDLVDAAAAWAKSKLGSVFRWIGYDGVPNHGRGNHLHLSWLAGRNIGSSGGLLETVRRAVIGGPEGRLKSIAQRAADRLTKGANKHLDRQLGALGGGPGDAHPSSHDPAVISAFRRAIRTAGASPVERLGLWEAGLVESGLQNLSYGDRDSVGALQQRPSQGWTGLTNPYRAALEFLERAKALRPWRRSAGALAQAVQNSAFPARYDQMRAQAQRYMARGGRMLRFAGGGRTGSSKRKRRPAGTEPHPTGRGYESNVKTPSSRTLEGMQTDRIGDFERIAGAGGEVDKLERRYQVLNRRFDLSDEELVDETTGLVDQAAVKRRADELRELLAIRERIAAAMRKARDVVKRIIKSYKTIIGRLQGSLKRAKGKKRTATRNQISAYRERLAEWEGKLEDTELDYQDSRTDVMETGGELAEVLGTQPRPPDSGDIGAGDAGLDTVGAGGDTATSSEPTPLQIAEAAAAQMTAFRSSQSDLFANQGGNFMRAAGGLAPTNTMLEAGFRYFGGGGAGAPTGSELTEAGGTPQVVQHVHVTLQDPGDTHTFTQSALHELQAAL